ncbi:hypothetical protein [Agromyces mediolanus]|uniref:hypothetical protein n=1 Tax=Agromyces mediolanus TaxID=41986 RepID=UPI001E64CE8C|nr:hypothetical protein [Agromyces mediolanus]MCD1573029.1 hypothetical protein [Agromyces mediolanus]
MTEAQVWTMLGVFTTLMFSMLTIVSVGFVRVLRAEIGGVRAELRGEMGTLRAEVHGEIGSLRSELRGEIGSLRSEIGGVREEMRARFEAVGHRIDGLDRDVQMLVQRNFDVD